MPDRSSVFSEEEKNKPATRFFDRHTHKRRHISLRQPGFSVIRLLCIIYGLIMPSLKVVLFPKSLIAFVVLFLALSLFTKDGLFAAIGLPLLVIVTGVLILVPS